jgi:hypothetical protein|tara:strand:- start:41 stop:676 length:636 start_codon:yes stop_codon:yes gene_type:complete
MKVCIAIIGGIFRDKVLKDYRYIEPCFKYFNKNVIDCNDDCDFDLYMNCWYTDNDIVDKIKNLYNPIVSRFEKPFIKKPMPSRVITHKRVWELIDHDKKYDLYLFLRADIMYMSKIILKNLNQDMIYHNDGEVHSGDFFYIMNYTNGCKFIQATNSGMIINANALEDYCMKFSHMINYHRSGIGVEVYRKLWNHKTNTKIKKEILEDVIYE